MRKGTVFECINVPLDRREVHPDLSGLLPQHLGIVYPLCTRSDLLTSQEEIIRIRNRWVVWIWHGVEWPDSLGEFVDDVEVLAKFLMYNLSKQLFILGANIIQWIMREDRLQMFLDETLCVCVRGRGNPSFENRRAFLFHEGDSVFKCQAQARVLPLQILEGILTSDSLDLRLKVLVQARKYVVEHAVQNIQDLAIVLHEGHLHVKACELSHVPVSERPFGAEDWANLKDLGQISHESRLLVELRRLCQICISFKIVHPKDVCPAL
mmetsp:Transcript_74641/g.140725  ORF Transcript_74641/g.140725 Transcript_74641/m.140725 type:complete len:266 (+) Transcript_74641:291-1088(+)